MKKIMFMVAITASFFAQKTFAQDIATGALQIVITDYLNLKNALAKDNADTAKAAAVALSADMKKVEAGKFSSDQSKMWMKNYEALLSEATHISATTDLKKQRMQFEDLSSGFYTLLKGMKVNTVDLFYQYCPMADAYWISENSNIVNPYFGKQMSSCGSTKETLKANR